MQRLPNQTEGGMTILRENGKVYIYWRQDHKIWRSEIRIIETGGWYKIPGTLELQKEYKTEVAALIAIRQLQKLKGE